MSGRRFGHTFNQAAESYHRARPEYPAALFDDLVAVTGLAPGDRLLEVGCATGKATVPLARRGFRVTCVELGPEQAAAARRNLRGLPAEVIEGRFEDWVPPGARSSTWSSPVPRGTGSIRPPLPARVAGTAPAETPTWCACVDAARAA